MSWRAPRAGSDLNYVKFFTDPYYTAILWTTVRIAVLVTAVCLVLGFPLAYVVARTQSRFRSKLRKVLHRPLLHGDPVDHGAHRRAGDRGLPGAGLPARLCRGAHPEPVQI